MTNSGIVKKENNLNKDLKRFEKLSNTDVLFLYAPTDNSPGSTMEAGDYFFMQVADLISKKNSDFNRENCTIFLQSLGGEAYWAYRIMDFLRENYKNITCIVPGVSKSSAAFLFFSSDTHYLHDSNGIVSDISLINANISAGVGGGTSSTIANAVLKLQGMLMKHLMKGSLGQNLAIFPNFILKFVILNGSYKHGTDIKYGDVIKVVPYVKTTYDHTYFMNIHGIHNEAKNLLKSKNYKRVAYFKETFATW